MSSQPARGHYRLAAFVPDELIVAVPHLPQVETVLTKAGAPPDLVERSDALELARLRLPEVGPAAKAVRTWVKAQGVAIPKPQRPEQEVDRLLAALRAYFQSEQAGWSPVMGKNRLAGAVHGGGGEISHGGGGVPVPVKGKLPARGTGPGRGVRVGVLDTALAPNGWLAGGWVAGYADRLQPADRYDEGAGHAAFVTGLVLSQAPGATVVARKVLGRNPDGEYAADCWTVATAIAELGRAGIDVLNLSLVSYTEDGQPPLLLSTAISRLGPDVVVVAAAGNHGDVHARDPRRWTVQDESKPSFPAALDTVVAVGAAGPGTGQPASFTPRNLYWIDLLAAGTDVPGSYLRGKVALHDGSTEAFAGVAEWSGSSFAAALVSGAIAAGVEPGRVTARDSLRSLLAAVSPPAGAPRPGRYVPPFVPLDLVRPR